MRTINSEAGRDTSKNEDFTEAVCLCVHPSFHPSTSPAIHCLLTHSGGIEHLLYAKAPGALHTLIHLLLTTAVWECVMISEGEAEPQRS